MSIMIKGIKFPDVGVRDVVIAFANHCLLIIDECGKELFYGEYVEIPTPHGRLIDADKLMQWIEHVYGDKYIIQFITNDIKRQPTIIEAEVEK